MISKFRNPFSSIASIVQRYFFNGNRNTKRYEPRSLSKEILEVRHMLTVAPSVVDVLITSSDWSDEIKYEYLAGKEFGDDEGFLSITHEDNQRILPWAVDRIKVVFDQDVNVTGDDFVVTTDEQEIEILGFVYDDESFIATLSVPEILNERLLINVNQGVSSEANGLLLDSSKVSNVDHDGDSFLYQFDVLKGDADGGGRVSAGDMIPIGDLFFFDYRDDEYSIFTDLNGNGTISAGDASVIGEFFFEGLDEDTPEKFDFGIGLTAIKDIVLDEDGGQVEIEFEVADSLLPGSEIEVTASTSNGNLIDGESLLVEGDDRNRKLTFELVEHANGIAEITLVAKTDVQTVSYTFQVDVNPVNDPPYVKRQIDKVTLNQGRPDRKIDLSTVFDDIDDDDSLSFSIRSFDSELFEAKVENGELTLTGVTGQVDQGKIVLRATDLAGEFIETEFPVVVNLEDLEELSEVYYAKTSDQIMRFNGQNTFILTTNFDESSRIKVTSANEDLLALEDIEIRQLGNGKHRVFLRHQNQEYGVTHLMFEAEGAVFADVMVIVEPEDDAMVDHGNIRFRSNYERSSDGLVATHSFNGKFLAKQLKNKSVTVNKAFSLLRPASKADSMFAYGLEGSSFEANFEPSENPNEQRLSFKLRISNTEELAPKLRSTTGKDWIETYGSHFKEGFSDNFDPRKDVLNLTNFLNPASFQLALINTGAKALIETTYELDPKIFGNETNYLIALDLVDIGTSGGDALQITKSLINIAETIGLDQTIKNAYTHAIKEVSKRYDEIANKLVNLSTKGLGVANQLSDDAKMDFLNQYSEVVDIASSINTESVNAFQQLLTESGSTLTPFDQDQIIGSLENLEFSAEELASTHTNLVRLVGSDEEIEFEEYREEESSNYSAQDQESTGSNGDQGGDIDQTIENSHKPHELLKKAFSTGKKLYDLAKSTRNLIGTVKDLFGSTASETGDYRDHDGKTYNLYEAQRGDNARHGDSGRDIINGSEKNDQIYGKQGNDTLFGNSGNDEIFGGQGDNIIHGGAGDDLIVDKEGNGILRGGDGDDILKPGAGNDRVSGELGDDRYVFEGREIGNDIITDPGRSGTIEIIDYALDEIHLRKSNYDLELILGEGEQVDNSIKIADFFANDAAGWTLMDQTGNQYSLYELTGRITAYEILEIAYAERTENDPVLPADIQLIDSFTEGRFTVHVAEDRRLIGENSDIELPRLLVSVEGNKQLENWLTRNSLGGLKPARFLFDRLEEIVDPIDFESVAIVGVGEGGLIAQWFSAMVATRGPSLTNAYVVNSPDISGLISQVVRQEMPEYIEGFPVLSNYFLVNPDDWVSKIGLWSGNNEVYANWKAFDFNHDPLEDEVKLDGFKSVVDAHFPHDPDFDKLQISDMDLSNVRGIVSLNEISDLEGLIAQDEVSIADEILESTVSARTVLVKDQNIDPDFDIDSSTESLRDGINELLERDPNRANDEKPFNLKIDFQGSEQMGEHTAPDHIAVSEDTLYNPDDTVGNVGWISLDEIKAAEDKGRASALERDAVKVKAGTFVINVPGPGVYNVAITFGDREQIQESMRVGINGYQEDELSTMPGDFLTRSYQVNTLDSKLRLSFVDMGGESKFFSINGLSVEKVNYRTHVPESERLETDSSLVILTQSYELPESNGFIEVLKDSLKAAAMAALTVATKGALGAPLFKSGLAAGVGTTLKSSLVSVKNSVIASMKENLGDAIKSAVIGKLKTSLPQHFVGNPVARGYLNKAISIFSDPEDFYKNAKAKFNRIVNIRRSSDKLGVLKEGINSANDVLKFAALTLNAAKGQDENNIAPWIYEVMSSLATVSSDYQLGNLDVGVSPVEMNRVIERLNNGGDLESVAKLWKGSRDFLVLDWVPEGLELTDVSKSQHRQLVNKSARAIKNLVEARIQELQKSNPDAELDLLLVSHGASYDITREVVDRLDYSDFSDALDYVKMVTLDPVSFTQKSGSFYRPELKFILDRVDNIYQSEDTPDGELTHLGDALDGRKGGSALGFYNRLARIFDLENREEILRYRHWDPNEVDLSSAELTDIEFSSDGNYVATSGKDGNVSVRYVDNQIDPETGDTILTKGTEKFRVVGQESIVRSLAFVEIEVEGDWRQFLLTISAARNKENTSIAKNKIMLTDVETGLAVWQGKDVGGTQVEASPSGNVIVSTDSNGKSKVWKRVADSLQFETFDTIDAHPKEGGAYIADVLVINDQFFVTAGLDRRMKLFQVTESGIEQVQKFIFDNPGQGRVRNLDYSPYSGVLAVGSGIELSLWKFDQQLGRLVAIGPDVGVQNQIFAVQDHVQPIQGISFSRPEFLLDEAGDFVGDRFLPGTEIALPRTAFGDVDTLALKELLASEELPNALSGLRLMTGGEDRTLFLYQLDGLESGNLQEETVFSGSMLPIRELAISPDGQRVALVGQDNDDADDLGGPIKDIDVTKALDDRLGWKFSELFLQGRREHNAAPMEYVYSVIERDGESFLWLRNSGNANRPSSISRENNKSLPPNRQVRIDDVDVANLDFIVRPGDKTDIYPLRYLLEVDRSEYEVVPDSFELGPVYNGDGIEIGTIRQKKSNGKTLPNVFVFEAAADLDFTSQERYTGNFEFAMRGPDSLADKVRYIETQLNLSVRNSRPMAIDDVVYLHPNRQLDDFRPLANDHDFDNDQLALADFPKDWVELEYEGSKVARYKKAESNNGIKIDVLASTEDLTDLLNDAGLESIDVMIPYTIRESNFGGTASANVVVNLALQSGPTGLFESKLGADQFTLNWTPVDWSANKYIVERYDFETETWVKHTEVSGNRTAQAKVKNLTEETGYWFRVVAKNTNTGRSHASFEGDGVGGFFVETPDYVGPSSVTAEALGVRRVQVSWERVYWNASEYEVKLYVPVRNEDGTFKKDDNGDYVYEGDPLRSRKVDAAKAPVTEFKELDPGSVYLATVTAKNDAGQAVETVSQNLVFTPERDVVAGIELERIGPKKLKVNWATVTYADRYRVVAVDPANPLDDSTRVIKGFNPKAGNTNSGVIEMLDPNQDYFVIVEARKDDHWVSIASTIFPPTVIDNVPIDEGETQIDLTESGSDQYLLQNDFEQVLRLPSVGGLFVGTTFSLVNLSHNKFVVEANGEDTVSINGQNGGKTQELSPVINAGRPDGEGVFVYRFESTEDGWIILFTDNTTEARYVGQRTYTASVPGTFEMDEDASLPRKPKMVWESPFWNVDRHRIEVYLAALDSEGKPILNEDGTYQKTTQSPLDFKNKTVEQGDRYFGHTFEKLDPDTFYIFRLEAWSPKHFAFEELAQKTQAQSPPTGIHPSDETLVSFVANWTATKWLAKDYRVVWVQLDDQGEEISGTEDSLVVSANKTSALIAGLETGEKYLFSVDAYSEFQDGWVINDDKKTVTILSSDDLEITGLKMTEARKKQIDIQWNPLAFEASKLFVNYRISGSETEPEKIKIGNAATSYTLTELDLNSEYDIWLEATVETSGDDETVLSDTITAATSWQISEILDPTVIGFTVKFPRLVDATKYDISVLSGNDLVLTHTVDANDSKTRTVKLTSELLSPDTEYNVKVVGRDKQEEIGETDLVTATTAEAVKAFDVQFPAEQIARKKFTVTWKHDDRDSLTEFTVKVSTDGENWLKVKNVDQKQDGTNIGNHRTQFVVAWVQKSEGSAQYERLAPGTKYFVQVYSVYLDGEFKEPLDPPAEVTTAVKEAPENVTAVVQGPTTVVVTWEHDGGGADKYVIQKLNQQNEWVKAKDNIGSTLRSFTLTNQHTKLVPERSYEFRVVADYPGDNEISESSGVVKMDKATAIRNLEKTGATGKEISVKWLSPSPNWDISNYRAEIYEGSKLVEGKNVGLNLLTTFKNLKVQTDYRVKVVARNPDLDGLEVHSGYIDVSTLSRTAPTNVNAKAEGPIQVGLTWSHNGAEPKEFRVQKKNVSGAWVTAKTVSATTFSTKINNSHTRIVPGRSYEFRVIAVYNAENKISAADSVTMDEGTGPRNVSVSNIRKKKVNISWQAPSPNWGHKAYRVEVRKLNGSLAYKKGGISGTSHEASDLKANTEYKLIVFAVNGDWEYEVPSAEVRFKTLK